MTSSGGAKPAANRGAADPLRTARGVFAALAGIGLGATLVLAVLHPGDSTAVEQSHVLLVCLLAPLSAAAALLASRSAAGKWQRGGEAALVGLALWMTIAVMVGRERIDVRAALNELWVWYALAAVFTATGRLAASARVGRAVAALLLAIGIAVSAHAAYQYAVGLPAARAFYFENPEAALREAGVEAPPGSAARRVFEDRLLSTEPTASFALTNSLAGFLTLVLLLAVGMAGSVVGAARRALVDSRMEGREGPGHSVRAVQGAVAVSVGILGYGIVLLLTKSRTAYVAVLVGLAVLAVAFGARREGGRSGWRQPSVGRAGAAVAGLLAIALVLAFWLGGWDLEVLTEAPRSVAFRFQYWRGSLAMIGDHPLFGIAPGAFQSVYAAYRVPGAHELIADPHNFFVEALVTGGVPAAGLVCVFLVCLATGYLARRRSQQAAEAGDGAGDGAGDAASGGELAPLLIGAAVAVPLSVLSILLAGQNLEAFLFIGGVPAAVLTLWLLRDWIARGRLPAAGIAAAVVATGVHLSGAGGLTVPGIGFPLVAAAALMVAVPGTASAGAPWRRIVAALGWAAVVVAVWLLSWQPVRTADTWQGRAMLAISQGDRRAAAEAAERAAGADRWAPDAALMAAEVAVGRLLGEDTGARRRELERWERETLRRDPRDPQHRRRLARFRLHLYQRWGEREDLERAVEHLRGAAEQFPTDTAVAAQLAVAAAEAGDRAAAERWARRAWRLDGRSQIDSQRLGLQMLIRAERIGRAAERGPATVDGETALQNRGLVFDVTKPEPS